MHKLENSIILNKKKMGEFSNWNEELYTNIKHSSDKLSWLIQHKLRPHPNDGSDMNNSLYQSSCKAEVVISVN